jgi:tRNA dimethylallyltransferase
MHKKVIIIGGPTAVGKTSLAVALAAHYNTEIISADSRQCFKELNIGVARPSQEELNQIRHHFIASHSIHDPLTAIDFEKYAIAKANELLQKKEWIILVGGTGLYIKAFMEGMDDIPSVDQTIREEIAFQYNQKGIDWLSLQLGKLDQEYAARGSMQNPQRMMRALEVVTATGKSILSYQQKVKKERPFEMIPVQISLPREQLYERINNRVDLMMKAGLLEEVKHLYPYRHLNALQTVGYRELFEYMDGHGSVEEAVSKIKQHTRHYAKRQETWFAHQWKASVYAPDQLNDIVRMVDQKLTS